MIGRSDSRIRRWQNNALFWFDEWFTSPSCVWQTLFACIIIVVVEVSWPNLDPHFFFLLMILTVYSAVTQPALAQSSAVTIGKLETLIENQQAVMERQKEVIDTLVLLQQEQITELEETGEILDDVHEILKRQEP